MVFWCHGDSEMKTLRAGGMLWLLVFLVALPGCRHSPSVYRSPVAPPEPGWLGVSGFRVRDTDYELCLPVEKFVASPPWKMEGSQEPPLLPGRAVWLARRAFRGEFADASSWKINCVSIETYPETVQDVASPIRDRRYYQVEFVPPEYKGPAEDHYPVWVLMDGTVVLPHPRKDFGVEPVTAPNAAPPHR